MTKFRPLARKNQEMTREECLRALSQEVRGILSVNGDDGYPYGVPINYWMDPKDGHIYFHGGKVGHRIDAIRRDEKVSFCVLDAGYREEGDWALHFQSVIVFGKIREVTGLDRVEEISREISYKFTKDEAYISNEIKTFAKATCCLELVPEFMTGKKVIEH